MNTKLQLGAAFFVALLCFTHAHAQNAWQDPDSVLLSDAKAREHAVSELKLPPGEWLLAVVTITPDNDDSDHVVESLRGNPRAVILVAAPKDVVTRWKASRKFRARILSAAPEWRRELGIFYLPTIIRVEDGRVTGARRK